MKTLMSCLLLCSILISSPVLSQAVGIGTTTPAASAVLDVNSNSKGMLMPRMTSSQRNAIPSPAAGLMVFDMDKNVLFMYDGVQWLPMLVAGNASSIPPMIRVPADIETSDQFGYSVDISGDYAIVGARAGDGTQTDQGAAYIFFRNNGAWVQQAKLVASDGANGDDFGVAVAISGDYAAVGAMQDDINSGPPLFINSENRGSVYIFSRIGTTWTQQIKFSSTTIGDQLSYGASVAMDANYLLVGCPVEAGSGVIYVYLRTGTTWALQQRIVPADGENFDGFGGSVDIFSNYLIAGAAGVDIGATSSLGAAYIYARTGSVWTLQIKLNPSTGNNFDGYGSSVAITDTWAAVGAHKMDVNGNPDQGRIFIYQRNGVSWPSTGAFSSPDAVAGDEFGASVTISGDYVIIGSTHDDGNGLVGQGSVYVYKRESFNWVLKQKILDPTPLPNSRLGFAVGMNGFNVVMTAVNKNSKGAVFFMNIE
jgi:hypothetical protein